MISVRRDCMLCMFLAVAIWAIACPILAAGQQAGTRRLLQQSAPVYPALARSMALQGIVKVEALVAPDGSVKAVEVKGGHPVLAQAAINTIRRWKWEAAPRESREIVEVKFSPE